RCDDLRAGPSDLVAANKAPDEAKQANAREGEPREVERVVGAARLTQAQCGKRDQDEPDRHVEPEDPLPGDALDDRAADERPDRDGQSADPAPRAEDAPTPLAQ